MENVVMKIPDKYQPKQRYIGNKDIQQWTIIFP